MNEKISIIKKDMDNDEEINFCNFSREKLIDLLKIISENITEMVITKMEVIRLENGEIIKKMRADPDNMINVVVEKDRIV